MRTPYIIVLTAALAAGCRGDLLTVPAPANAIARGQLVDSAGAEALRTGTIGTFSVAVVDVGGLVRYDGFLTDEFYSINTDGPDIAADTRSIHPGDITVIDHVYTELQQARIQGLYTASLLEGIRSTASSADVGEMFGLAGYVEVLLGEHMCSGVPFAHVMADGTVQDGDPLATDSIFGTAIAHFDSAAAHATGSATVAALAAVGRARAFLDRGRASDAAAAAASVPASFLYTLQVPATAIDFYHRMAFGAVATMVDGKGTNGLPYVSAHDARLPTHAIGVTYSTGAPDAYPLKFGSTPSSNGSVPLADGVESGLIQAEAALDAQDVNGWLATLNALRANFVALRGPYPSDTTYHQLTPLVDPGSDSARVTLMFRERAFWLYGTGHRLGDLRRLMRSYGRDAASVFPVGAYMNGTASSIRATYGTDVSYPIGPVEQANPRFHGCLNVNQ